MNIFPLVVATTAAAAIASPLAAQDATALATKLVDMLTPAAQTKEGVTQQVKAMREGAAIRAMLSRNPAARAELARNKPATNAGIARIGAMQADSIGPIMLEAQAASRKDTITNYAEAFSAAELKQLLDFYGSPLGLKLRKLQPEIARRTAAESQKRFAPRLDAANKALAPKIEPELRKMFGTIDTTK